MPYPYLPTASLRCVGFSLKDQTSIAAASRLPNQLFCFSGIEQERKCGQIVSSRLRQFMPSLTGSDEFLSVSNLPAVAETGGGHGAKGVDFQRWWAVLRMLELEQGLATSTGADFLLLFEAVQDVAELDSSIAPTRARIYQVKKKDRGEWPWLALTGTKAPPRTKGKAASVPKHQDVKDSPLGKLYASLEAFSELKVEGIFISNAGCNIPLADGSNAATAMPSALSAVAPEHLDVLQQALTLISGNTSPDMGRLVLQKVAIHPDSPESHVIHTALDFLKSRSPKHAGQAKSFVEALFTKISPLGRHTDTCSSFSDLAVQRGFSRAAFQSALANLEETPDLLAYLEDWLAKLSNEGMDFMTVTRIRSEAARVFRERLLSAPSSQVAEINSCCDAWISENAPGAMILPYFNSGVDFVQAEFSGVSREELLARFALRAINKCVVQT